MRDYVITAGIQTRADNRFLRFHKAFEDAVSSRKLSAIVEVLLRAQVSGDRARRTAEKILADQQLLKSEV